MKQINKGFTLIELLIVIAIIAVISTLTVITLANARVQARDTKRLDDLKQLSTALELYYNNNSRYPEIITAGQALKSPNGKITYLNKIPSNPSPRNDGDCSNTDYSYQVDSSGKKYTLATCLGAGTNDVPATAIFVTNGSAIFPCGIGKVNDVDGNLYETVQIGTQCWMKQNLRTGTKIYGKNINQADANEGKIQKYCYDDADGNCLTYGGLYQWHTAMALPQICDNHNNIPSCLVNNKHQGICPTGWHIPTVTEFQVLAQNADPGCVLNNCITAGGKLKAISWDGTDNYGFSALPAGFFYYNPGNFFLGHNDYARFWSALPEEETPIFSWNFDLRSGDNIAWGVVSYRSSGFSVRCLKN